VREPVAYLKALRERVRRYARDRVQAALPELPGLEPDGGPIIPQAVVIRHTSRGQEVLLVKRTSPRAWELPGGYIDEGEAVPAAALREVREETGLEVRLERLVGWYRRTGFRPHRSPVFACTPVGGEVRLSSEAVAIGYFPVTRLPLGLFPWYREVIRDAVAGVSHGTERVQHLGATMVAASTAIHLGERAGILA
jgi:8-oxo-dGTP pyrophosphatase MutT (NUDIX family)